MSVLSKYYVNALFLCRWLKMQRWQAPLLPRFCAFLSPRQTTAHIQLYAWMCFVWLHTCTHTSCLLSLNHFFSETCLLIQMSVSFFYFLLRCIHVVAFVHITDAIRVELFVRRFVYWFIKCTQFLLVNTLPCAVYTQQAVSDALVVFDVRSIHWLDQ